MTADSAFDQTLTDENGMAVTAEDVLLVEKDSISGPGPQMQDETNRSIDLSQREPLITNGRRSNDEQDLLSLDEGLSS
jgi:hypothetical protein